MSRKLERIVTHFIFLILFSTFIYGVPPFEETQISGEENHITIVYPKSNYMPFNEDGILSFDILNSSLHRLDNLSASCNYATVHHHGSIMDQGNLSYNGYWFLNVDHLVYSETGVYNYYVYCNSSNENGYLSASFILTETGAEIDDRFNYGIVGGILIILFILIGFMHSFKKDQGAIIVYGILGATICFLTIWSYVFGVLYIDAGLRYYLMGLFAGIGLYMGLMAHFFYVEIEKESLDI